MKYSMVFILLGISTLAGCLWWEGVGLRVFIIYLSLGFFAYAPAYWYPWPWIWQKQADGTLHPSSYLLLAPLHLLNWLSLLLAIALEKNPPFHEVAPNLWIGRRLLAGEAAFFASREAVAVLDLTCELSENRKLRRTDYLCIPVLDHTAPTQEQIRNALAFVDRRVAEAPVYVHCALGHGRSATVVIAWLLQHEPSLTVEAALTRLQTIRSGVSLEAGQLAILRKLFGKTLARQTAHAAPDGAGY